MRDSTSPLKTKPSVAFSHLGCEKNLVDTEHMIGLIAQAGYSISNNEDDAAVVVVNTCSFIQDAREESIKTLVNLAEKGKEIIIAGCLAQHFKGELLDSLPEARAVVGTGDYQNIVDVLKKVEDGERVNQVSAHPQFVADENLPRYRTTNNSVAYLKIAEGCDYKCAFCIIPQLRGKQRSRTIESIISEANQLAKQGVQELILISQISTNYGKDLYGRPYLAQLLRALGEVKIPWIRVHYAYPTGLTSEVLNAYREVPNVLPYLDLPLQHSHQDVLKAMNRPWQVNINRSLLDHIREQVPEAVLRTSLIVGFPGETQEHFDHLTSFVEEQRFDHVGVFIFSSEEGTQASEFHNQVPLDIAVARKDKLMSLQQSISSIKNSSLIGKTVDVLVEKFDNQSGVFVGRCARFAPEIDGEVFLNSGSKINSIKPGMMVPALITGADMYDLNAEIVSAKDMVHNLRSNIG